MTRLQKIDTLEAQLRQHKYAVEKGGAGGGGGGGGARGVPPALAADPAALAAMGGGADGEQHANTLLDEYGAELGADENLIEVWVVEAVLDERALELFAKGAKPQGENGGGLPGLTSFVVVDFYNFESQATKLLPGLRPEFDFATTTGRDRRPARATCDRAARARLCEAQQADFELPRAPSSRSARCSARARPVLRDLPLFAARGARREVGRLHVEVRMAQPVSELFQVYLERHP